MRVKTDRWAIRTFQTVLGESSAVHPAHARQQRSRFLRPAPALKNVRSQRAFGMTFCWNRKRLVLRLWGLWRRGCGGLFSRRRRNQCSSRTRRDYVIAGNAPLSVPVLLEGHNFGCRELGKDAVVFEDDPLVFFRIFGEMELGIKLSEGASLEIPERVADPLPDGLPRSLV